ncbi:spore germination protein [Paenibacillus alkalitolerans]|uniref:spore germination protein n=1 Tax=Paenibacillus alkalitolerans TaxID=2799335 RepID=UPI001F443B07|nr:spore germination protein [Paenibacillus alkalitolerans]
MAGVSDTLIGTVDQTIEGVRDKAMSAPDNRNIDGEQDYVVQNGESEYLFHLEAGGEEGGNEEKLKIKPPESKDPHPYKMTPEEKRLKEAEDIPKRLKDVKRILEEKVGLGASFDVLMREMTYGGRETGLFYLNGFAKDEVLTLIMMRLTEIDPKVMTANALQRFFHLYIPHIQVEKVDKITAAIDKVLAGGSALFIDGETSAIVIDAKTFPQRGPEEPSLERVVRGARDGFIETVLTNVTMVRRRLRDPRLKLEMLKVGRRSKTDVCVAYINDIADLSLVDEVKKKIAEIDVDGIVMADKELEEAIVGKGWSPFPAVRYTERPDVAAYHLIEGHVCLFVDTSPSVIVLPTTFFHHVQHAEEYRQNPFIGTYMRWVRFFGIFASLFMLPLWLLLVLMPEARPEALGFIGPQETGRIPLLVQFLLVEVGVDMMRLAAIHTPTPLSTAMGLIAAILIGDIAVEAGLFVNEVILYMAVAAVGMFATPSYELGLANRIVRLALLISVAAFRVPGFVVGTTLIMLMLITKRSYKTPYLWPFIPFNARGLFDVVFRRPFLSHRYRTTITKPQDRDRMTELQHRQT